MKYFKRINLSSWLILIFVILKILLDYICLEYNLYNILILIVFFSYSIYKIIKDIILNKNIKILYGVVSGDYEVETFDVTGHSFKSFHGYFPDDEDKSVFYMDLYRLYNIPITTYMRNSKGTGQFFKIKLSDYGIISMKKIREIAIKKYNY